MIFYKLNIGPKNTRSYIFRPSSLNKELVYFAKFICPTIEEILEGGFNMKNIIKFGLVGFAGYLVGFYECKYKMLNIMWESKIKGM